MNKVALVESAIPCDDAEKLGPTGESESVCLQGACTDISSIEILRGISSIEILRGTFLVQIRLYKWIPLPKLKYRSIDSTPIS